VRTPQGSQLTIGCIGSVKQTTSGSKKGQKRLWDENSPKDKITLVEKKLWDVTKIWCFNCEKLGHFAKDCEKVR